MTSAGRDGAVAGRRRWLVLVLGHAAQTASCVFLYGIPFLVPAMRAADDLTLGQAGAVVAAPSIGLLPTLIVWGAAADRYGERRVMAFGLGASGVLLLVAGAGTHSLTTLFALFLGAGAATASVNASSGRVVMGWFSATERGRVMGIRQTAQPLGVGLAALALPPLAGQWGFRAAMLFPAGLALVVAVLVARFVVDPPRPPATASTTDAEAGAAVTGARPCSPYRAPALWRLHAASALLVVPQFAVSAFAPVYLVSMRGWDPLAVGGFLAVVQGLGALGRLASGYWSDRVGSRLRPMRVLAVAGAGVMALVAVGDLTWAWLAVLALVVAAVVTVSDNGLGFTASAELAGPAWAGRAMGAQNTAQNVAAALTPPLLGLVIGDSRYALAFALTAAFPILAARLTPVAAEQSRRVP